MPTFLFICFVCITPVENLNILVWSPVYGQSHVNFMGNIADILVLAGHNVTMLLVVNDRDVQGTGTKFAKVVKFISPLVEENEWANLYFKKSNIFYLNTFAFSDYLKMENINYRICKSMIEQPDFLKSINEKNYDVLIVEMFHFCPIGIAHLTRIRKIVLASALGMTMAHYELTGIPISLSNTPVFLTQNGCAMTLRERIYNIVYYYSHRILFLRQYYTESNLFNSYFGAFPDLFLLYKEKSDYIMINSNDFSSPARPLTANIIQIGGAHIEKPKPLPKVFDEILKIPSKATIIFSLGSIVKSREMPLAMRYAFLEAFRSFSDYQFIWKDELTPNSSLPNVHFSSWLPQIDLLAHPRVKVFITHGGMNSIQESLFFGVPMIIIPIFADQEGNAALAQERGYALKISKFDVAKDVVVDALKELLNEQESSYSMKTKQVSRLLRGTPEIMRREIARIVQISGEEDHLTHLSLNSNLSWFQYYNLDAYSFLMLYLIVSFSILFRIFKHIGEKI